MASADRAEKSEEGGRGGAGSDEPLGGACGLRCARPPSIQRHSERVWNLDAGFARAPQETSTRCGGFSRAGMTGSRDRGRRRRAGAWSLEPGFMDGWG